jgi:hypothetical protein
MQYATHRYTVMHLYFLPKSLVVVMCPAAAWIMFSCARVITSSARLALAGPALSSLSLRRSNHITEVHTHSRTPV